MLNLDDLAVRVHPGDGLTARFPGVAVVVLPPFHGPGGVSDELLAMAEETAGGPAQGHGLAREVARLLTSFVPEKIPSFAVVTSDEDGLMLLLHAAVGAEVTSRRGKDRLCGARVGTIIERIVEPPIDLLVVGPARQSLTPVDLRSRLLAGVVPGSGLSIQSLPGTTTNDHEAGDATVIDRLPPPGRTIDVMPPTVPVALVLPQAPSVERGPSPLEVHLTRRPSVEGVICPGGHFSDPSAPNCGVCGIAINDDPPTVVQRPRPSLGLLVFDDGRTVELDLDWVLGREPELDESVIAGEARPFPVTDPERTVSRVHVAILLDGWQVCVVDRGSANGTYVSLAGQVEDEWQRLTPNRPTAITAGTRVRFGRRLFAFQPRLEQMTTPSGCHDG